ncbi:hypothetical protein CHUAL_001159 [Chamberlinius hualienensis]
MAETVDLIRDYCKKFILRPINEEFKKNECYFDEKIDQMEKHFIQRLQQLEILIETNNRKTGQLDKTIETLQLNQNRFEGKSEFILETNEKKFQQNELRLNDLCIKVDQNFNKPCKDLTEMEKKFEEITESVKESEIQNKKLSQNIKSIEMDFSAKFRKTTEVIGQLQLEMREKDKETGSSLEEIVEKCKKVEKETKQTIDTFIKTIKDKYEKCIQNKNDQIKQSKKVGYGTMQIIVCFVSVALLCFQVETAIKAIKSDEIKPLKTEVDVIEKRVKQINFQIELDKVINIIIK